MGGGSNELSIEPNALTVTATNTSLSGSNLTVDGNISTTYGDILMNAGDITQVGNISFNSLTDIGISYAPGTSGNTIRIGGLGASGYTYPASVDVMAKNGFTVQSGIYAPLSIQGSYLTLRGALLRPATTVNANVTIDHTGHFYNITTPNITVTLGALNTGQHYRLRNNSTGNITVKLMADSPASYITLDGVLQPAGDVFLTLPTGMTLELYYDSFNFTPGLNRVWQSRYIGSFSNFALPANVTSTATVITGTNLTVSSRFNTTGAQNHAVSTVANGTITSTMHFVKVTGTGNCTIPDGASGDWLTIKNYSGGVVTLVPTGDTIDGNATLSLNDKEAVNLTSDGSIWMIH